MDVKKWGTRYFVVGGVFGALALVDGIMQRSAMAKAGVAPQSWGGILFSAVQDTVLWPYAAFVAGRGLVAGQGLQAVKGLRMLVSSAPQLVASTPAGDAMRDRLAARNRAGLPAELKLM